MSSLPVEGKEIVLTVVLPAFNEAATVEEAVMQD